VSGRFAGIDVGERRLHGALVDASGHILDCTILPAGNPEALVDWCGDARFVAVDAPQAPSTAPHAGGAELAPKFRAARCAEIELGLSHGSWVAWVAPGGAPFPRWMEVGFAVFRALGRLARAEALEVYPHAAFRELAGGRRLPRKRSQAGRRERAELLARAGLKGAALAPPQDAVAPVPPHDVLDSLAAALVALDRSRGRARRVGCGHDDSAIWLPGPPG
jgi:predicted nuclease with RNAse H fold